jgi:hypothetical protein
MINNKFTNFVTSQTVSEEAPNMETKVVIMCCLVRAITHMREIGIIFFYKMRNLTLWRGTIIEEHILVLMQFLVSIFYVLQNAVSATEVVGPTV